MFTKEELEISEAWEYFDQNGIFPFEKKRLDITLESQQIDKLKEKAKNENTTMSNLIRKAIQSIA